MVDETLKTLYRIYDVEKQQYVKGYNRESYYYPSFEGALKQAKKFSKKGYYGDVFQLHIFEVKFKESVKVE